MSENKNFAIHFRPWWWWRVFPCVCCSWIWVSPQLTHWQQYCGTKQKRAQTVETPEYKMIMNILCTTDVVYSELHGLTGNTKRLHYVSLISTPRGQRWQCMHCWLPCVPSLPAGRSTDCPIPSHECNPAMNWWSNSTNRSTMRGFLHESLPWEVRQLCEHSDPWAVLQWRNAQK